MVLNQAEVRGGRKFAARGTTPFPTRQLFILSLCRICEPIAFMSIFPYVYYMISSFKITHDERQIAIYAGMVTSAFAFAEFSSGVVWGRLSDKVGRKPVLITGLAGTGLSMLIFGFAPSLPVALLARALGGLLNGNIGVLQTTVAEMVTVKEHQPRAYTIMPFVWSLGSFLGPALGGALAQPCESYPVFFRRGTVFDKFPFLLPNLVCTAILGGGVVIGILFLEETHGEKKFRRDIGLEAGQWILRRLSGRKSHVEVFGKGGDANLEDRRSLLDEEEEPPGYRTTEGSPRLASTRAHSPVPPQKPLNPNLAMPKAKPRATIKAFTKPVILTIIAYGILAYHTISFEQLMPILLSMPLSHEEPSLPFRFVGGFALSTKTIGFVLSLQGIYSMLAQLFLVPFVLRRFGSLKTFRCVAISYPILYFAVPYLVLFPENLRMVGIYFCLIWKVTAQALAYPANAILLTNAAPSMLVLGAINGIAAATASLCRAFGPTVSGLIHSAGLDKGYSGLAWWVCALVCVIGAVETSWMDETAVGLDISDESDEEAELSEPLMDQLAIESAIAAAGVRSADEDANPNVDNHPRGRAKS